jgi:hypothetical protein
MVTRVALGSTIVKSLLVILLSHANTSRAIACVVNVHRATQAMGTPVVTMSMSVSNSLARIFRLAPTSRVLTTARLAHLAILEAAIDQASVLL